MERFAADQHLEMVSRWSGNAGTIPAGSLPTTGFVVERAAVAFLARAES